MLEWIILAFFTVAIIWQVAKAITKPMIRNVMNLVCIPIAFGISAMLHKGGLFRGIMTIILEELNLTELLSKSLGEDFGGSLVDLIETIVPVVGALAAPFLFVATFHITFLILKFIHVTFICRYIRNKNVRREKKELRKAIKAEKERLRETIIENEERTREIIDALSEEQQEAVIPEFVPLDDDDIDDMVEDRVKAEKKRRKKQGYFRETTDRKVVSILVGALTGFLLFAVTLVPAFYQMEVLSNVTNTVLEGGKYEDNSEKTTVYLAVEFVDKYFVDEYEDSFVINLYEDLGIVKLLNRTIESGAEIAKDKDGDPVYANKLAELYLSSSLKLACATLDSRYETDIRKDMQDLLESPLYVNSIDTIAEIIVSLASDLEEKNPELFEKLNNPDSESAEFFVYTIIGEVIRAYKDGEGNWSTQSVKNDMNAMSEVVVVVMENKLLAKIISEDVSAANLIEDKPLVEGLLNAMVSMTAYTPIMKSTFTTGVNLISEILPGIPANKAAGYDLIVEQMLAGVNSVTAFKDGEMIKLQTLFEGAGVHQYNAGKINYIQGNMDSMNAQIDSANARIEEIIVRLADINAELSNPDITSDQKKELNAEKSDLNGEKNTLNIEIELFNEELVKLNSELDALYQEREENTEKMSILDYILDPLYVAEIIQADARELTNQSQELLDSAEKLKESIESIKAEIEELNSLLSDMELTDNEKLIIEKEIEAIDQQLVEETTLTESEREKLLQDREFLDSLIVNGHDTLTLDEYTALAEYVVATVESKTSYNGVLGKEEQSMRANAYTLEVRANLLAENGERYLKQIEDRLNMFTTFITYFMNWMYVQKPFMVAGEDTTSACLSINIGGVLYVCNTDVITFESILDFILNYKDSIELPGSKDETTPGDDEEPLPDDPSTVEEELPGEEGGEEGGVELPEEEDFINIDIDKYVEAIPEAVRKLIDQISISIVTAENEDEFEDRISPVTTLVNFLIGFASEYKSSGETADMDEDWLYTTLESFPITLIESDLKYQDQSGQFVLNFLAIDRYSEESKNTYDYKGVMAEDLRNALHFEAWEAEGSDAKYTDTQKLVDIIFSLADLIPSLAAETAEGEEVTDETKEQMNAILMLLSKFGETMDLMSETECLGDLPYVMLMVILKNPMLSQAMTPGMLNEYMTQIEAEDFTYQAFMEDLVTTIGDLVEMLGSIGGEE